MLNFIPIYKDLNTITNGLAKDECNLEEDNILQ